MATYAIGDLQACYSPFRHLLDRLKFEPAHDRLWLTGDLVNRGPESLSCLHFVRDLGAAAVTVLGNHDLHLLAVAHGGKMRPKDTFGDVLAAPDRDELLDWLRRRPLLHEESGRLLIHAGVPPQWDLAAAVRLAREAEAVLRAPDCTEFFDRMYGDEPDLWDESLAGSARTRFVINCLTRLRYCDRDGRVHLSHKGAPGEVARFAGTARGAAERPHKDVRAGPPHHGRFHENRTPTDLFPWFTAPGRRTKDATILFGHWSLLGRVHWPEHGVYGLDTGCVWGKCLTALCLETGEIVQEPCA